MWELQTCVPHSKTTVIDPLDRLIWSRYIHNNDIEDTGQFAAGIAYTYWEDNPPPNFRQEQFLRFTFGGRAETLRKER